MDTRQAACRRRPRELLVKVVAPSMPDLSCDQLLKYWKGACAPMVAEIDRLSDIFYLLWKELGA